MKRLLVGALVATVMVAGCGGTRSQPDQDKDGRLLADALRSAYSGGSGFKMDQQLVILGGDIPSGKAIQVHATVDNGVLKNDTAKFGYKIQQGRQTATYDMLIAQQQLYVKAQNATTWKTTALLSTTTLYPTLRLDLVRETVLLARSISSGTITHIDAGFARKYTVQPAPDQLEQLESIPVQGTAEDTFLKTARAQMDIYLVLPATKLGRIELQMTGTDPSNGERQDVTSTLDLRPARVSAIQAPSDAEQVSPADILK